MTSVAGKTGAVSLVKADISDLSNGTSSAAGLMEAATAAEFRSDDQNEYKALTPRYVWDAAAEVYLGGTSNITPNFNNFINGRISLTGNRTLNNGTNDGKVGQTGLIRIEQDATGGRTLSFGSDYEFAGGTAPTLSTASNAEDLLFYHIISSTRIFIAIVQDVS